MTDQACATECSACADERNLAERRAVDYLIEHGMGGSFTDKADCIDSICNALNECQVPDEGLTRT